MLQVGSEELETAASALIKCGESMVDAAGLRVKFDISRTAAINAILGALVSVSPYESQSLMCSGTRFYTNGVLFPPREGDFVP